MAVTKEALNSVLTGIVAERDAFRARIAGAPQAVIGTGLNINIDTKDRGKASKMIGDRVRIVSMDSEGTV